MTTTTPWFDYWTHFPKIPLDRVFGDGSVNLVKANIADPGTFRLVKRFGHSRELVGFQVFVDGVDLKLGWEGLSLAPVGSVPLIYRGKQLAPWKADQSLEPDYSAALTPFIEEQKLKEDGITFQRLEGYFPVTDSVSSAFNLDRVRIFRIQRIIEGDLDLVLILLTLLQINGVSARQDGGGSGPPKPP